MCKQRLVLDLWLQALTGKIGRIHSKQGFSELSVFSYETSEKPLLSPDCARAVDFANMCKQRLVLDLQLPALTGKIGIIHSKQGFSELSVISPQFLSLVTRDSKRRTVLGFTQRTQRISSSWPFTHHPSLFVDIWIPPYQVRGRLIKSGMTA